MNIELDDNFMFLDETIDFEAEIVRLVEELSDEEKQLLLDSQDLPDCIVDALTVDANDTYNLKRIA